MNTIIFNKKNQSTFQRIKGGTVLGVVVGIAIGAIVSFIIYTMLAPTDRKSSATEIVANEPLYWVAPMDANYRRDKPGKSPMGMDLVPVYDNDNKGPDEGEGTISISPDVINNLGVRTSKVSYHPLNTTINTVGYITYDEDKFVHINPRVEGWIEKLYVEAVGDPIKKGQALYEIYSPELVNAQEEFLLALERNNKRLISAAKNRLASLQLSEKTITALAKTRKIKQNITFYAPQNGVVERLNIRAGVFVKPETTLLSIIDLSHVWVKVEVFESQVSQLAMGNDVVMTLGYLPNKTWQGKIEHIHPMLNPKTRTAIVRLGFDNANGQLKPNMLANIVINTADNESVLLIPKEALIRTGKQNRVVLALGKGRFKSISVKVGRYDNDNVEILTGLNEGDSIVSSAQFLLDSESSKSSDFKRMNHDDVESISSETTHHVVEDDIESGSVWVTASIESLMPEHKMLTLTHAAIPEWDWPKMTMDFIAMDNVDFSMLTEGLQLDVELTKTAAGGYLVSDYQINKPQKGEPTIPAILTMSNDDLSNDAMVDHASMKGMPNKPAQSAPVVDHSHHSHH